jgi:hypothetical protein
VIEDTSLAAAGDSLRKVLLAVGCAALLAACNGEPGEEAAATPESEPAQAAAAPPSGQRETATAAVSDSPPAEALPAPPAGQASVVVEGEARTLEITHCVMPSADSPMVQLMAENEDGDSLFVSGSPGQYRADVRLGRRTHVTGFIAPFEGPAFEYHGVLTTSGSNAQVQGAIHAVCEG